MRRWGLVCLLALVGCYRGPSGLSPCAVRCTEGCPSGTSCVNGYCASAGESCVLDAPGCGDIGQACCDTAPVCNNNGYCSAGTCVAGCVTEVALGRHHMCVLEHDSSVWCSGNDATGELGTGATGGNVSAFAPALDSVGAIIDATDVCSGYEHSCAVRAGGTVSCWGGGTKGALGNNAYNDSVVAVQVVQDTGAPVTGMSKVACGRDFSCALATDSTVWCWGDNSRGQLGDGTGLGRATATQIQGLTGVTSLASGHYFSCTLDTVGQIRCWGYNSSGQIGDGTRNLALAPTAVTLANVTQIAAGVSYACAILSDTSIMCWGSNGRRWLGNGTPRNTDALTPTPVLASEGTPYNGASAIALGAVSCALHGNTVDCWGDDTHGQIGNGGSFYPRSVTSGVDGIDAHYAHVCAHHLDGDITCWGHNEEGELGDGSFHNHGTPVRLGATCATSGM